MSVQLDKAAIWEAMVDFIDDHAEIAVPKTWTPKPLTVWRGPRAEGWIESIAPCIIVDLLRQTEEDSSSQRHQFRWALRMKQFILGVGASPEDADDMALELDDRLNRVFSGTGAVFGSHGLGVVNTVVEDSGWEDEVRGNMLLSGWVRIVRVQVRGGV